MLKTSLMVIFSWKDVKTKLLLIAEHQIPRLSLVLLFQVKYLKNVLTRKSSTLIYKLSKNATYNHNHSNQPKVLKRLAKERRNVTGTLHVEIMEPLFLVEWVL